MITKLQSKSGSHKGHTRWTLVLTLCVFLFPSRQSFSQLAEGHNKFVGNVIGSGSIRSDFSDYWNQVTPENAGKWRNVQNSNPNSYNWSQLDAAYNYAIAHGFKYKHHTLIWGQSEPSFLGSMNQTQQYQAVENWIRESGQRYSQADFVDVVNEPLHAAPMVKDALGGNGSTGWDWVVTAFTLARQYWPNAKLILNEYYILSGGATTQFLQIVNILNARGLIDGIGVQGHWLEGASASLVTTNLNRLAATGLPVYVSELDLCSSDDAWQQHIYETVFAAIWEHPAVRGITIWGYAQGHLWQSDAYLVRTNGTERPALQWMATYLETPLAVKELEGQPTEFSLSQNYPNPFNPTTAIRFDVPDAGNVRLEVFNLLGQRVATLVDKKEDAGTYEATWDASGFPSGMYVYRLQAGTNVASKKLMLVK